LSWIIPSARNGCDCLVAKLFDSDDLKYIAVPRLPTRHDLRSASVPTAGTLWPHHRARFDSGRNRDWFYKCKNVTIFNF